MATSLLRTSFVHVASYPESRFTHDQSVERKLHFVYRPQWKRQNCGIIHLVDPFLVPKSCDKLFLALPVLALPLSHGSLSVFVQTDQRYGSSCTSTSTLVTQCSSFSVCASSELGLRLLPPTVAFGECSLLCFSCLTAAMDGQLSLDSMSERSYH